MNQLWNRCLHQKNCGDGNKECNKLYVPKLSILAVVLTATMTGNSAFALIEEDVNAPNSVQAPNVFADRVNANQRIDTKSLNITEFGGTTYTQLGVKNKRFSTTEKEGYIQTGYIKADEIQAGTLIATDGLTTKSLFVTEKLTASGDVVKKFPSITSALSRILFLFLKKSGPFLFSGSRNH